MHTPSLLVWSGTVAVVVSLAAAAMDRRTGLIPNWLTIPTAIAGIVLSAAFGHLNGTLMSLVGLLIGAVVPILLFAVSRGRAIGGGDVKLFAALGAVLGPSFVIEAEFGAFVLLCVFALIRLAFCGRLLRVLGNAVMLILNPFLPRSLRRNIHPESMTSMRMGPAIATAVLSTLVVEHLGRALPWIH